MFSTITNSLKSLFYFLSVCHCFSIYQNEDITPEIDKLDAMMSSITHEMEADSSLAASVVTAFLRREHALVEQNAGDYCTITFQVMNGLHRAVTLDQLTDR